MSYGGGGSFQLRLDSTVFSCNGLWNIALVEWAPLLLRWCKDANQHLGVWNVLGHKWTVSARSLSGLFQLSIWSLA